MAKVIVRIEEHLVKEIEVECANSMNVDERMELHYVKLKM